MLKGVHLTLLMGPAPIPAPKPVMDALLSAQVTSGIARGGFQLVFGASKQSVISNALIPAGFFGPSMRVVLVATVGSIPEVLVDGIITRQEVTGSNEAGQTRLSVTGEDLSVLMDVVKIRELRYPAMPIAAIVNLVLAKYAAFGIVPLVIPPLFDDTPSPTEKIRTQTGTDLEYLRGLAQDNGYVFFVQPGPLPGQSIAYWGPDIRIPNPQPALRINMDANTNVESLSFSLDGLAKKVVIYYVMDPVTRRKPITIPLPNKNIQRPPLGAVLPPPLKVEFADDVGKKSVGEAIAQALARTAESSDSVTANGQLDVLRYGRVLKARQIVGVAGGGVAYDGFYYVRSVTHNLKPGEYKQSFQLSRDGLVSLSPRVAP
jgi:hypothetical protein